MTGAGEEEARRRARRAAARRLHPDVGGDRDAFDAAMRATEPRSTAEGELREPVVVVTTRRARARRAALAAATRATRHVRGRLPASWPGARRYGRL